MTLLQKLDKELAKLNLKFNMQKEFNEKYKGTLEDTELNYVIKYEVPKALQYNMVGSYAKQCRKLIDMHIQYDRMIGKEKD